MNDSTFAPQSFLDAYLSGPVDEFLSRPKKDFRGELVQIGFSLYSKEDAEALSPGIKTLSKMLEWIHAGSLIIDDIQDNSHERRGSLSMHLLHGIPCAINAANWMYFEALKLVHELPVKDEARLKIIHLTHSTMAEAHQGQALDLTAHMLSVPREDVFEIGMRSHQLKSGALVSLALQVGALLGNPLADIATIGKIGSDLGASLQRFDDLGNLRLGSGQGKALEDLRLGRPSWVWMFLSRHRTEDEFSEFKESVSALPDEIPLNEFLIKTQLKELALREAKRMHRELADRISEVFPAERSSAVDKLKAILEKVANAYT